MAPKKSRSTDGGTWGDLKLGKVSWRPKTLVVDDSQTRRSFLADWLRSNRFVVETFVDGASVLAWLYHAIPFDYPDMIVTDVKMPNIDGLELVRRMRLDDRFASIAVLVYSTDVARALETDHPADGDNLVAEATTELRNGAVLVLSVDQLPAAVARQVRRMAGDRKTSPPTA